MILNSKKLKERRTGSKHNFERNYLYSYVTSCLPSSFVTIEKIVAERKLRIFICTWNMNGKKPPEDLHHMISSKVTQCSIDLVVVGTQETYMCRDIKWVTTIQNIVGSSFVLRAKQRLGKLHLVLFLRRELLSFSSITETNTVLSNKYTIFKTKGAVSISLIIFGTSFLFITTHLAAHQENTEKRLDEMEKIIRFLEAPRKLPLKRKHKDVINNFDRVFLFGDLNFRINKSRQEVMHWINTTHFPNDTSYILQNDQLRKLLGVNRIFKNFEEASITFPPTYKYSHGSQVLDSNKHRVPSYTDRILYKSRNSSSRTQAIDKTCTNEELIACLSYDSARSICSSDHKPVYGIYDVSIRAVIST